MTILSRRALFAGMGVLIWPAAARAQASIGVALVIGNSQYKWEAPLPNAKRDAADVARAFQELGLKTELIQDGTKEQMFAAVERLKAASNGNNFAAFYYAGHGASWDKDTYMVPVDVDLATPETVKTLLPVRAISQATKGAAHRLLVLDNCRNNPADGWRQRTAASEARQAAAELAATDLHGPNTLILFSTAPGYSALDGASGQNSPFTTAFLRQLVGQSIDFTTLAANLRRELMILTGGRQVLWDETTFAAPFIVRGPKRTVPALDESNVIELPNAYAYARRNKIPLPAGLVAVRSPEYSKYIGAFEYTTKTYLGIRGNPTATTTIEPFVLLVLSARDDVAQIVFSGKDYYNSDGFVWRFATAKIIENELIWSVIPGMHYLNWHYFKWRDANSGRYTTQSTAFSASSYSSRFNRLD